MEHREFFELLQQLREDPLFHEIVVESIPKHDRRQLEIRAQEAERDAIAAGGLLQLDEWVVESCTGGWKMYTRSDPHMYSWGSFLQVWERYERQTRKA
jgi:hypothetical protein